MEVNSLQSAYPLTPVQQGMLFHHLRWPGAGFDIEQIVCTLPEAIAPDSFAAAWRLASERHPALKTTFVWEGLPEPRQYVADVVNVPLTVVDWSAVAVDEHEAALERWLADDRAAGFDPRRAPLFRVSVLALGAAGSIVVWTLHHLLLDGRSFAVVLKDVFDIYEALEAGVEPPPVAERPSFKDFIDASLARDRSQDEAFWRDRLKGVQPTPLPIVSRAAPATAGPIRGEVSRALPPQVAARLTEAAEAAGVSLNVLVQAAWAVVLGRYADRADVVFGAVRSCRRGAEWSELVGMTINTVPMRVSVEPDRHVREWLASIAEAWKAIRDAEQASLVDIHVWSGAATVGSLFETVVVFDRQSLNDTLTSLGGRWSARTFRLIEQNTYPLTLAVTVGPPFILRLEIDRRSVDEAAAARMLGHVETVLEALPSHLDARVGSLPIVTKEEEAELAAWNDAARRAHSLTAVHEVIARQAERMPERAAGIFRGGQITYRELDARADRLADHLVSLGARPGTLVGLSIERSLDLLVGLLAVLKSGAAYLPLDPDYPADRLRFMIEDSHTPIVVGHERTLAALDNGSVRLVSIDAEDAWTTAAATDRAPASIDDLAYVIYTSGSTGTPKGVMVSHRNVANFLSAMDEVVGTEAGVWLAVTSLSFDISVLELLWTLARGFTVVVHGGGAQAHQRTGRGSTRAGQRPVEFSLFYFAADQGEDTSNRYGLLMDGARFADERGFAAVWTPERHFHAFGGLYSNPSVVSAAIAAVTTRVQIRAGSVVLPLHHPARVAEEWAIVDNLSQGRVGISFASGWQPDDFVLNPGAFAESKAIMLRHIDIVRRLWRGEAVPFDGPRGPVEVRTLPRPVQAELPYWITSAGNPDTFRAAGAAGANVLTHLLGQSVPELADKLAAYREAWHAAGHPGAGHVTLMLHTFVGDDEAQVKALVREPMKRYLASSVSLIKSVASSFPVFQKRGTVTPGEIDALFSTLSAEELDALTEHAFNRYYETGGLFGTPERCLEMVDSLRQLGVGEIACLIDFGVPAKTVLAGLERLDEVRARASAPAAEEASPDATIAAEIAQYGVTHLQCTPSLASMLVADDEARGALGRLRCLLVGGEALAPVLAQSLCTLGSARVVNMYGPTETTVWSTSAEVRAATGERTLPDVTIGRPIANTSVHVLDSMGRTVPIGVPGELCIGGDGVALGYFERPDLTAERFVVASSNGASASGRLYRTGDLVRYRADGQIEFLGRLDHQVKLRGHRIELGEIESVLRAQPSVSDAAVVAREDTPGDVRLVAYVCGRSEQVPDVERLRTVLGATLPAFMVPADIVSLVALPRTPNGKLDRAALPIPNRGRSVRSAAARPPASELEKSIAAIWCEALGVPAVGVDDNFFDMGGHSLLTVQVRERLRQATGRPVAVTDMFQFPTVAAMARHLQDGDAPKPALERAQQRASRRLAMRRTSTGDTAARVRPS